MPPSGSRTSRSPRRATTSRRCCPTAPTTPPCSAAREPPCARASAAPSAQPIRAHRLRRRTCPDAGQRARRESSLAGADAGATVLSLTHFLILGATGFVGRSVCEKLVERSGGGDDRIRVATRRVARARHLQLLPTVELAPG